MNTPAQTVATELDVAYELLKRIEAMCTAPYWSSDRRTKIIECAQRAQRNITIALDANAQSLST